MRVGEILWVCEDCLVKVVYGEPPTAPDGGTLVPGMPLEEHSCGADDECDCAYDSFSWSPCGLCASAQGGERHAVSSLVNSEA
jgi:hypothetical protein